MSEPILDARDPRLRKLLDENDALKARAEQAEKACAEKDEALRYARHWVGWLTGDPGYPKGPHESWPGPWSYMRLDSALSSDAGRDYVRRVELENLDMNRAMEVGKLQLQLAEAEQRGWRKGMIQAAAVCDRYGSSYMSDKITAARYTKISNQPVAGSTTNNKPKQNHE